MSVTWEEPEINDIQFPETKKCYAKLQKRSLLFDMWVFFDVPEYYADNLFIRNGVYVIFGDELAHPDSGYRAIICTSLKFQRRKFEKAIKELPYIMALNGHGDYVDFCADVLAKIEPNL